MAAPSCFEMKRFRRHLKRRFSANPHCDLCGTDATIRGEAMEWLDSDYPERRPLIFVLCACCRLTNYRDRLNALHKQVWHQRYGVAT